MRQPSADRSYIRGTSWCFFCFVFGIWRSILHGCGSISISWDAYVSVCTVSLTFPWSSPSSVYSSRVHCGSSAFAHYMCMFGVVETYSLYAPKTRPFYAFCHRPLAVTFFSGVTSVGRIASSSARFACEFDYFCFCITASVVSGSARITSCRRLRVGVDRKHVTAFGKLTRPDFCK